MFGLEILGVVVIAVLAKRFFDGWDAAGRADDVLEPDE
jgi:hypothetical protein